VDETTLSLHPPLRACWMKRGQQKCIPAAGIQQAHHLFAAYEWETDTVTWTSSSKKNSDAFITFLEHLLVEQHPTGRCILVLDNAPYHVSRMSRAALSLFEHRVLLIWLPPYCALELNPIERFWRHLKDQICVNKLFPSLPELVEAVETELKRQNDLSNESRFRFSKHEL
jgi:transposase